MELGFTPNPTSSIQTQLQLQPTVNHPLSINVELEESKDSIHEYQQVNDILSDDENENENEEEGNEEEDDSEADSEEEDSEFEEEEEVSEEENESSDEEVESSEEEK